jgi:hypothetical protein
MAKQLRLERSVDNDSGREDAVQTRATVENDENLTGLSGLQNIRGYRAAAVKASRMLAGVTEVCVTCETYMLHVEVNTLHRYHNKHHHPASGNLCKCPRCKVAKYMLGKTVNLGVGKLLRSRRSADPLRLVAGAIVVWSMAMKTLNIGDTH